MNFWKLRKDFNSDEETVKHIKSFTNTNRIIIAICEHNADNFMSLLYTRKPVTECFYNGKQAHILNIGENFETGVYYEYFKNITNKLNLVWNEVDFNNVTFEDDDNILCRIIEMSPPSIIGQACAAAYNRVMNK